MSKNYFAWTTSGKLVALGECENFDDASEKEPPNTQWLFDEPALRDFQNEITQALKSK